MHLKKINNLSSNQKYILPNIDFKKINLDSNKVSRFQAVLNYI